MLIKVKTYATIIIFAFFATQPNLWSQDLESAELTLEDYSDEFQEHFFEALKQKGIENYDKAIASLYKCKKLDPNNPILDYELGKNYLNSKKYEEAEEFLHAAVLKEPENEWFLRGYYKLQVATGNLAKAAELGKQVVAMNPRFKESLARLYLRTKDYDTALKLLQELDDTYGKSQSRDALRFQVNKLRGFTEVSKNGPSISTRSSENRSELDTFMNRLSELRENENYREALQKSNTGLSLYPSQPRLYYYNGWALNRKGEFRKAIFSLESGLDYIIDDPKMEVQFYEELSFAYQGINDQKNARQYLRKAEKTKKRIQ
ncbi:tetratricopeptide repeat protein [Sungkyunkwania multivorans]|uniref:Tetratricopeptide repeat protein n=1 Tax=Sungkyunkwania multivorans TaxID=1173618 RepID=A0ABW3CZV2_9FLAO